jgi:hypothetical protein
LNQILDVGVLQGRNSRVELYFPPEPDCFRLRLAHRPSGLVDGLIAVSQRVSELRDHP